MTGPLRVLIVGAGWAAERHANAVVGAGDRVVAVVDPAERPRAALASRTGAQPFGSLAAWGESGPEADAVVVASPSSEHLSQTIELLSRGLAVLVEKPHRLPGQAPAGLLAAAARSGAVVQVGMTTRFAAGMQELRRALADGLLGRVAWVEDRIWLHVAAGQIAPWYFDVSASGGGVLVTNGVHALDRVAWLLDEPLALVDADLRTLVAGRAVEDAALLRLRTPSGVDATISLLWPPYPVSAGELRVTGTRGTAVVRPDGSASIVVADGDVRGAEAVGERAPFERQWAAFRASALAGEAAEPSVETVERALATIERAYADARAA